MNLNDFISIVDLSVLYTNLYSFTLGKSFREEQCDMYNSPNYLDYNRNMKQWIPKYAGVSPRDRCKLFCRARGSSEFKVFEPKVQQMHSQLKCNHYTFHIFTFDGEIYILELSPT